MKIRIILKSFDKKLIALAKNRLTHLLFKLIERQVSLPIQLRKFCVLRSPHVNKDSREHFELRLYKHFVDVKVLNPETLNSVFEIDLPDGVEASLHFIAS